MITKTVGIAARPAPPTAALIDLDLPGLGGLALTLFFNFTNPTYGGPVAFFSLMGGLGIVLLWTRFIADEISF